MDKVWSTAALPVGSSLIAFAEMIGVLCVCVYMCVCVCVCVKSQGIDRLVH